MIDFIFLKINHQSMSLNIFDPSKNRLFLVLSHMGRLFFLVYDVDFQKFITIGCFIYVLNLILNS